MQAYEDRGGTEPVVRKPYVKPELVRFGAVVELTQSGTGQGNESGSIKKECMSYQNFNPNCGT